MTEDHLLQAFSKSGQVMSVKMIRDKTTGAPQGYGFVEFSSHEVAQRVLNMLNGTINPQTNKQFRLNWGVHGAGSKRSEPYGTHYQPIQGN